MPDADQPSPSAAFPQYNAIQMPLPTANMVARARAFADARAPATSAVASATVMLLRDGDKGLEVFMLRRHSAMATSPGRHVFPGGLVDAADYGNRTADEVFVIAAIRETFEETGVLMATSNTGEQLDLESERIALVAHQTTFDDVLARHNLTAELDALRPWAHWITPLYEPRRYDTRFFVARVRDGIDTREIADGEADRAAWMRPADALATADILLMPPTEVTLRELDTYESAAAVWAAASQRRVAPILIAIDLDTIPPRFVIGSP